MKTIDYEFSKLCGEIDYWQAEAKFWKKEAEEAKKKHIESINNSIKSSKETIGIMLGAVVDPNSIINKGHRKALEEQLEEPQNNS